MAIVIFILLIIGFIYISSLSGTPSEYKLNIHYQLSSGQEKLKTDIEEGLKSNIMIDILSNNYSNKYSKLEEIESFINMREATFYFHIESLSKRHKISHDAAFKTIFEACNSIRNRFNIPIRSIPEEKFIKKSSRDKTQVSPHSPYQLKERMKESIIEGIETSNVIKKYKNTELESAMILNYIAKYCEGAMENYVDNSFSKGLTKQEAIYVVKTATNEVIDMYIADSKNYHIK